MDGIALISHIAGPLISEVTSALLILIGAILTLIVSVWSALQIYAYFKGVGSNWVTYKIGRLFGEFVFEKRYRGYAAKRDRALQNLKFKARYNRESGG